LQASLNSERADKQTAQKQLQDVKMQLKSLESSFDELMQQNIKARSVQSKAGSFAARSKDD
jgi:hypothetical protein